MTPWRLPITGHDPAVCPFTLLDATLASSSPLLLALSSHCLFSLCFSSRSFLWNTVYTGWLRFLFPLFPPSLSQFVLTRTTSLLLILSRGILSFCMLLYFSVVFGSANGSSFWKCVPFPAFRLSWFSSCFTFLLFTFFATFLPQSTHVAELGNLGPGAFR